MLSPRPLPRALAVTACLLARTAAADSCPAPAYAPAVADIDAQERIAYLARAFDREIQDIDVWSWSWGSVYAAGAVAQGVLLPLTSNAGKRIDYDVGIASTAFGAVALWGLPLQLTLPLRAARPRWHDGGDPCVALARAERALGRVERDQRFANGVAGHLGNLATNLIFAAILGFGYHRWPSAALSAGVGIPIGEANAFTQPHHLGDVLARYRTGQLDTRGTPGPALSVSWSPVVTRQSAGAAVAITW